MCPFLYRYMAKKSHYKKTKLYVSLSDYKYLITHEFWKELLTHEIPWNKEKAGGLQWVAEIVHIGPGEVDTFGFPCFQFRLQFHEPSDRHRGPMKTSNANPIQEVLFRYISFSPLQYWTRGSCSSMRIILSFVE